MQESFSPSRAVEILLYISSRLKKPTIHEVLKIQYFADKLHFSRYGFMSSGDRYVAMEFGPVGSNTYNVIKAARGERGRYIPLSFVHAADGALEIEGKEIRPLRDAEIEQLSEAETECLNESIAEFGNMHFGIRTDLSHDAAWDKAWASTNKDMAIMDIVRTLPNADEVIEHLNT
jgi:uncharacterized phage-associated protein